MDSDTERSFETPSLAAAIAAALVTAPAAAFLIASALGPGPVFQSTWPSAVGALAAAALLGIPALGWSLERGRTSGASLPLLGVFISLVAMALILVSGAIGAYIIGDDVGYVRWVFAHGAPVPGYGMLAWSKFGALALEAAFIGVVSGTACLAVSSRRRSPAAMTS